MRTHLSEAEAIVAWLQTPLDERCPLPPKQQALLERWNVADNLLREHLSERKVVPMLMDKWGYSESSARRDLDCARRVWGTRPRADKDYLANMLIDYLTETMVKAGKASKFGDVSRLAKVIIEAAGLNRREEEAPDPAALERPVALVTVYSPELVGGTPMTEGDRAELVQRMLRQKREKGFVETSTIAQLAQSTDHGPAST